MREVIISSKNPKIRNAISLKKGRNRKELNQIIIEGVKEVEMALKAGLNLQSIFVCSEYISQEDKYLVEKFQPGAILHVSGKVYNQLAYRKNAEGIIAIGIPGENLLADLPVTENSLYIIIESVEKPGNLGAILRTSDAAGVSGVIVCDSKTDIYNPNVIRSSLGTVFSVAIAITSSEETLAWLKANQIRSLATYLDTSELYYNQDFSGSIAIIMGTESEGLSNFWKTNADVLIRIPMKGKADSINVSASAAIVLFEAVKQREIARKGRS